MYVLLIEDDDVDAMIFHRHFKKLLPDFPGDVVRAENGLEALNKIRDDDEPKPDVAVLDLRMPKMGGLEFLEELRQDERVRELRVVVLTSSNAEEDVAKSQQHNVAGYFLKSTDADGYVPFFNALSEQLQDMGSSGDSQSGTL